MRRYTEETQTAAKALGVIQVVEVRSLGDFEQAFDMVAKANLEGIVLPADGSTKVAHDLLSWRCATNYRSWSIREKRSKRAHSCPTVPTSRQSFVVLEPTWTK